MMERIFLVVVILSFSLLASADNKEQKSEAQSSTDSSSAASRPTKMGVHDSYGRLITYPGKKEVICPVVTEKLGVILVIGQSNSANYAEKMISTKYPKKVINYFNGKCYEMASPLLGAGGENGEFITLMADNLIEMKTYSNVLVVSSGIGASLVSRWGRYGDLNEMLLTVIDDLKTHYSVTDIVWHQGESDYSNRTTARLYTDSFLSMIDFLKEKSLTAPLFIAVATKCTNDTRWTESNPVANAQRNLVDNKKIFLGADTDAMMSDLDRRPDICHLSEQGQIKVAKSYAAEISKYHSPTLSK